MERIIKMTARYATRRSLFGTRLFDHQSVSHQLAQLNAELDALRALLYSTTLEKVRGRDVTVATSKCKYLAGQLARRIPDKCLQVRGEGN